MTIRFNIIYNAWNAIVYLCASYAAIIYPLQLIFNLNYGIFRNTDPFLTLIFLADFFINANKDWENKRTPNFQSEYKNTLYMKGLILTDLLAAIPFGVIFQSPFFYLLRIFKLIRGWSLFRTYRKKQIKVSGVLMFLFYLLWILLIIHWLGCAWIALRGIEPDTDATTNYINAIYWTITTLTTVGYGDILPVTNLQKLYSMFVQVLGFGVFGFLIGTIASALLKKDPAKAKYYENIENLASLLHYKTIPSDLRKRIIDFYTYMWKKRLGYDETLFLQSLPENLQTEVALHLKKDVIEKISLFNNTSDNFKKEIALMLKPKFLTPGDYVFKAGDYGEEMYFVVSGELNTLTQKEDRVLTKLKSGDFFGEIALIKNKNRSASVKSKSYCDIYVLDKKAFNKVLSKYPEIGTKIKSKVELRESRYEGNTS